MMRFADRAAAGKALAHQLRRYRGAHDAIVLGLPRGGVPVAYEVAVALELPLDVMIVRKLGAPGQPEFALGAIATGGVQAMNDEIRKLCEESPRLAAELAAQAARERAELLRREAMFRPNRGPLDVQDKTAILVDDGVATGASMCAAVRATRMLGAARVVVAVPVAAADAAATLRREADEFVCVMTPDFFRAVGEWYRDFTQTEDDEVSALLARAQPPR